MSRTLGRARFAVLLLPAFLGGCYVVPIVPIVPGRPGYEYRHPGPYYGPYRGYNRGYYYRGGQAETPAATQASASSEPPAHVEVASISR